MDRNKIIRKYGITDEQYDKILPEAERMFFFLNYESEEAAFDAIMQVIFKFNGNG